MGLGLPSVAGPAEPTAAKGLGVGGWLPRLLAAHRPWRTLGSFHVIALLARPVLRHVGARSGSERPLGCTNGGVDKAGNRPARSARSSWHGCALDGGHSWCGLGDRWRGAPPNRSGTGGPQSPADSVLASENCRASDRPHRSGTIWNRRWATTKPSASI
jgi:hypothetical protein